MKNWILTLVFLAPLAFGDGLRKEDLGARPPGPEGPPGAQKLTPEQMQQLQSMFPGAGSSQSVGGGSASPEDLERLMQELKKLNKVVEDRNQALEKLVDETP